MDRRIELRISAEKKAAIEEAAKGLGLSTSAWIRLIVARGLKSAKRGKSSDQETIRIACQSSTYEGDNHRDIPATPAIRPYSERVPPAMPWEFPVSYADRLARWAAQEPNPAKAQAAADAALRDYRSRWPEIQRQMVEARRR